MMMMISPKVEDVVPLCEELIGKNQAKLALEHLKSFDCTLSNWAKAKAYISLMDEQSRSFAFVHYPTDQMIKYYGELVSEGFRAIYRACVQLRTTSPETRSYVQDTIWAYLTKLEDTQCSWTARYNLRVREENMRNVESLIAEMSSCSLNTNDADSMADDSMITN